MRIKIDENRCTGHGLCYAVAPDLVDADDRGYGLVIREIVPEGFEEQARAAERSCPERAIVVTDE